AWLYGATGAGAPEIMWNSGSMSDGLIANPFGTGLAAGPSGCAGAAFGYAAPAISGLPQRSRRSGAVDLHQFVVCRLHRRGGVHTLNRLRVHVDDDVLRLHLG